MPSLIDPEVLFTSIWTYLFAPTGTKPALYTALTGRLYRNQAPQGATWPYATWHLIADEDDDVLSTDNAVLTIQFNLFSDTPKTTEVSGLFQKLKALFNNCGATLTMSGYVCSVVEGWGPAVPQFNVEDPEGRYHQISKTYRFTLEAT